MQEEFIEQYKTIQKVVKECYSDTNIALPFTIEDVLKVFMDIAQSH